MANVSQDELQAMMSGKWGNILCFECDGRVDEIPSVLLSDRLPYWLVLGSEREGVPPQYILIDPFRQARQNGQRVEMWKQSFKSFVDDLQKGTR